MSSTQSILFALPCFRQIATLSERPRLTDVPMPPADLVRMPFDWLSVNYIPIFSALLVLVVGWYVSRLVSRLFTGLLPRAQGVDQNFAPLLGQAARYGVLIFAVVTALGYLGVPSASIYAVLGAAGLAIALALQNTLANIAAGIMLVWLRPIAIGEYIVGDGVAGVVVEIGLFGTRLRSTSGLYIFTPNQKLWSSAITNHSREPRRSALVGGAGRSGVAGPGLGHIWQSVRVWPRGRAGSVGNRLSQWEGQPQ